MSATTSDNSEAKSLRGHFSHPMKPREFVQFQLGVIDGEEAFGRFFSAEKGFINLLDKVQIFIERGMLYTKKDKEMALNPNDLWKIRQVWHGPIFMVVERDPYNYGKVLSRKISFTNFSPPDNIEVIRIPALKNMDPVDQLKSQSFLLRMREVGRVSDRIGGMDYRQAVLQGRYYWDYKNNRKPMFNSDEEVEGSKGITMSAGRNWFHAVINFEHQAYKKYRDPLYADICEALVDDYKHETENISHEDQYTISTFTQNVE